MEGKGKRMRVGRGTVVVDCDGDVGRMEYVIASGPKDFNSQVLFVGTNKGSESVQFVVSCSPQFLKMAVVELFEKHPEIARDVCGKYIMDTVAKGALRGEIEKHKGKGKEVQEGGDFILSNIEPKGRAH